MTISNKLEAAQFIRIVLGARGYVPTVKESANAAQLLHDKFESWDITYVGERDMFAACAKARAENND